MTEQQFRLAADRALDEALRALLPVAEREPIEVDLHNGVLQVVFEAPAPATFVANAHAPARQIWVSAKGRAYRLAWSDAASAFVLDGDTLATLLERLTLDYVHGRMR